MRSNTYFFLFAEYVLGDTSLTILSTKKSDAGTYIYRAISLGAPQTGLKEIKFEVDSKYHKTLYFVGWFK